MRLKQGREELICIILQLNPRTCPVPIHPVYLRYAIIKQLIRLHWRSNIISTFSILSSFNLIDRRQAHNICAKLIWWTVATIRDQVCSHTNNKGACCRSASHPLAPPLWPFACGRLDVNAWSIDIHYDEIIIS